MESPPPPPPHGSRTSSGGGRGKGPRSGGLPDGKYDIFIVPPSSAGSGFLYLPSLQTNRNSFLAGVVCTSASFFFYSVAVPVIKEWFHKTVNSGGSGVLMLVLSVGVIAWALGKTQGEGFGQTGKTPGPEAGTSHRRSRHSRSHAEDSESDDEPLPRRPPPEHSQSHNTGAGAGTGYSGTTPPQPTPQSPPQQPPPPQETPPPPPPPPPPPEPPKQTWQRPTADAKAKADAKSSWERAREETKKREDEKRKAEELKRRRDELEKERLRQREREARERLERELKEKRERELKDAIAQKEREQRDAAAKTEREERERKEKLEREEKERKEKMEKEERERRERDIKEAIERERKNREMAAKEKELRDKEEALRKETEKINAERIKAALAAAAEHKKPPIPTAKTEKDDDAYSFRPYDRARSQKTKSAGSVYSDDSYAPSATTAKTTPPGSDRPYSTKDPDKIIIKAVYSFNNAFTRTPIAQLISGRGSVTDGLILRITTEGLFIDDDVRSVPQREWDVKAWTMKLAETCEISGMHVLRASIRDQEGKKYVFIINQSEGWKVALGLQRLKKGSQVRALGVTGLPMNEAKLLLDNLGWSS